MTIVLALSIFKPLQEWDRVLWLKNHFKKGGGKHWSTWQGEGKKKVQEGLVRIDFMRRGKLLSSHISNLYLSSRYRHFPRDEIITDLDPRRHKTSDKSFPSQHRQHLQPTDPWKIFSWVSATFKHAFWTSIGQELARIFYLVKGSRENSQVKGLWKEEKLSISACSCHELFYGMYET